MPLCFNGFKELFPCHFALICAWINYIDSVVNEILLYPFDRWPKLENPQKNMFCKLFTQKIRCNNKSLLNKIIVKKSLLNKTIDELM